MVMSREEWRAKQSNNTPMSREEWRAKQHESLGDTAIRVGSRALTALPEFAVDVPAAYGRFLESKINPLLGRPVNKSDGVGPVRSLTNMALEKAGISPKSSGMGEDVITAGLSALSGAGASKLAGLSMMAAKPISQAVAAASGSLAGGVAREMDAPVPVQIGAQIAGGMIGSGATDIARGITNTAMNVGKTALTDQAKKEIAARALYSQTTRPEDVIARLENPALRASNVPGSRAITSEIAQDPGFSQMVKSLSANPSAVAVGADQINNLRTENISRSVDALLKSVNREKSPETLNRLSELKTQAFNKFTANKDLSSIPVDQHRFYAPIVDILKKYEGDTSVEKMIRKTLTTAEGDGLPNFNRVWNARKVLDRELFKRTSNPLTDPGTKGVADVAANEVRTVLNNALKESDPDFSKFLRTYSRAERGISAVKTGRAVADKMRSSTRIAATGDESAGIKAINAGNTDRIVDKLRDAAGNTSSIGRKLTPSQRDAFDKIAAELARSGAISGLGAPANSATASYLARGNLLTNDIIDGLLGTSNTSDRSLIRSLAKGISGPISKSGITAPIEEHTMEYIGNAARDPDIALELLKLGLKTKRGPLNFKKLAVESSARGSLAAGYADRSKK